jgi:hypothetical protein
MCSHTHTHTHARAWILKIIKAFSSTFIMIDFYLAAQTILAVLLSELFIGGSS